MIRRLTSYFHSPKVCRTTWWNTFVWSVCTYAWQQKLYLQKEAYLFESSYFQDLGQENWSCCAWKIWIWGFTVITFSCTFRSLDKCRRTRSFMKHFFSFFHHIPSPTYGNSWNQMSINRSGYSVRVKCGSTKSFFQQIFNCLFNKVKCFHKMISFCLTKWTYCWGKFLAVEQRLLTRNLLEICGLHYGRPLASINISK